MNIKRTILMSLLLVGICWATVNDNYVPQHYIGNGSTRDFAFPWPIEDTSDVEVIIRTIATEADDVLTETTDYAISAINNDYSSGGTVTTVATYESTSQITIRRDTPPTQNTGLVVSGSNVLREDSLEDAYDKLTRLFQELQEIVGRCLKIPKTETSNVELPSIKNRADKNITSGADGNIGATSVLSTGTANISAFGEILIDDDNPAEARGTLELDTDDDVEFAAITGTTITGTAIAGTTGTFSGAISGTTGTLTDLITKGPWFDVRAYGAGTSESASTNATAIQAAIDAAELVGGCVTGAPGEYEIDTQLTIDAAASIWWPGATIKQEDGADQTFVLKIDVGGTKDISLLIKVDGNMDNNTAIEGIVLNGIKRSHGLINVTASECDTGIVVENDTEANLLFLKGLDCGVGVLERADGAFTPNENTIFVNGHNNATHYKKESSGLGMTSVIHFSCEQASAYAVIIDGGLTILNGELRGCQDGGIDLISGNIILNNPVLRGADVGWALRAKNGDNLHGSLYSTGFDGGVWIKECDESGSLYINCRSCFSKPAIKLGDKAGENTFARRFTILPGSAANSQTGPTVEFDYSLNSMVNLGFIFTNAGDDVLFDAESDNDTLVIPVTENDITPNVHASAVNPTIKIIGYGTPPSFADVDDTPSILMGNVFLSGTAGETITDFTDKAAGKEFTIISKAVIVYDTTGTNLVGSSTDITTASGDVTKWICEDATTVRLLSFVDVSADNSGGI